MEKKKKLFCLTNVLYTLKAASIDAVIDAVIYIMKDSFLKRHF